MTTQGAVVVRAVRAVFGDDMAVIPPTGEWSERQRHEVFTLVLAAFKSGECEKRSGGDTDDVLMKYIPGLVNNWVRKSPELNGNTKYVAKRPGSRSGNTDPSVVAMRALLSSLTDPEARAMVKAELDKRIGELKPKVEIDPEKLPEHLRYLIPTK